MLFQLNIIMLDNYNNIVRQYIVSDIVSNF